jgi:alkylation response protein AidB-like acyl-CoA dehydrogenase
MAAGHHLVTFKPYKEKKTPRDQTPLLLKKAGRFELGPKEDKLGIRGSDTTPLNFNDVKVPKGKPDWRRWLRFQIRHENFGRRTVGIAVQALGMLE